MAKKKEGSPYSQILVAVVVALVAGGTAPWWWGELRNLITGSPPSPPPSAGPDSGSQPGNPSSSEPSPAAARCSDPWEWSHDLQSCVRAVTVPSKAFSIGPLQRVVDASVGRIDFYANVERLPGTNIAGGAIYRENDGVLQVVIPVMAGSTMVGEAREIIFSTREGRICRVSSLPEATGWLRKMRVSYSLSLETDCRRGGRLCQASLVESGRRVRVALAELRVTIGPDCRFGHAG